MFTFLEHREIISRLQRTNAEFRELFKKHGELGNEIIQFELVCGKYTQRKLLNMKQERVKIMQRLQKMIMMKNNHDIEPDCNNDTSSHRCTHYTKRVLLTDKQRNELNRLYNFEKRSVGELSALFCISKSTAYRIIARKRLFRNNILPGRKAIFPPQ